MQLFKTFITYLLSTLLKLKITRTALETIKLDNNYPVSIQTILNIYHTCLASVHTQTFTHLHIFVISTHTHTHIHTHLLSVQTHTHTHTLTHVYGNQSNNCNWSLTVLYYPSLSCKQFSHS